MSDSDTLSTGTTTDTRKTPSQATADRLPGEAARALDDRSIRERMQLDSKTIGKLAVFASGYVALLWVLIEYLDLSATRSVTGIGALVPAVVVLAFLFETMDSAAGMGFGTALSPLLLALGYDPLAVAPALLVSESLTGFIAGSMHNEFRNAEFSFEWPPNEATKLVSLIAGIGVTAVIGSVVLTYLALSLPDSLIKTYVAILVIVMGIIGIVRQYIQPTADYRPKQMIAFAALAGFNKGIGGGGYGPVVTLGELYSGVYEKSAAAITSLAEGFVSIAGIIAFLTISAVGIQLNFVLLPSLLAGSLLAGVTGPYLVRVFPNQLFKYVIPTYAFLIGLLAFAKLYLL